MFYLTPMIAFDQENNIKAIASVMKILNTCAIKKAYKGFLLFCLNKSEKFVSKPMLVKASANHKPCKFFKLSFTVAVVSGEIKNEKRRDAAIKPKTNFGNLSQITFAVGLALTLFSEECFVYVQ
jgi:hypothetical protein